MSFDAETLEKGLVEAYLLPDWDLWRRTDHGWALDGRPAVAAVRFPKAPGEVLVSEVTLKHQGEMRKALDRLRRGVFGGATEAEAQRLRRDRAAAARIAHGRFVIATHRVAPRLGEFVRSHAPRTHHAGEVLPDPFCVLCGDGGWEGVPPFYPCPLMVSVTRYHEAFPPGVDVAGWAMPTPTLQVD